ncbi:hypothetical protein H0H92_000894 [Tricholoma furcatifolium]|nr:hypothetical protein H0H92_000894 [Tricholoma furcatifolium]
MNFPNIGDGGFKYTFISVYPPSARPDMSPQSASEDSTPAARWHSEVGAPVSQTDAPFSSARSPPQSPSFQSPSVPMNVNAAPAPTNNVSVLDELYARHAKKVEDTTQTKHTEGLAQSKISQRNPYSKTKDPIDSENPNATKCQASGKRKQRPRSPGICEYCRQKLSRTSDYDMKCHWLTRNCLAAQKKYHLHHEKIPSKVVNAAKKALHKAGVLPCPVSFLRESQVAAGPSTSPHTHAVPPSISTVNIDNTAFVVDSMTPATISGHAVETERHFVDPFDAREPSAVDKAPLDDWPSRVYPLHLCVRNANNPIGEPTANIYDVEAGTYVKYSSTHVIDKFLSALTAGLLDFVEFEAIDSMIRGKFENFPGGHHDVDGGGMLSAPHWHSPHGLSVLG